MNFKSAVFDPNLADLKVVWRQEMPEKLQYRHEVASRRIAS